MTRQEFEVKWDGMSPRERDAWIAREVMGMRTQLMEIWGWMQSEHGSNRWNNVPHYTTERGEAFMLLDKFKQYFIRKLPASEIVCGCSTGGMRAHMALANTEVEAICKSALMAALGVQAVAQ